MLKKRSRNYPRDGSNGGTEQDRKDWHYEIFSLPRANGHHLTLQTALLMLLIIQQGKADEHMPHQPFKWSLIQLEESRIVESVETPGAPSFKTKIGHLVPMQSTSLRETERHIWVEQTKYYACYLCPASNPG